MKAIAIDFETANSKRSSVCALGIAVIEGNKIVERDSWLIHPPELWFHSYNTAIHGISEDDVRSQPEFNELWPMFTKLFEGNLLLAHNAVFDISVLRSVLDTYELPYPTIDYLCTRNLAKIVWPKLNSYGLAYVSDYLGIGFKHHDAEDDAMACAKIAIEACKAKGINSVDHLPETIQILKGRLIDIQKPPNTRTISGDAETFDIDHPFFEKEVVFTGTLQSMTRREAMHLVVNCGGSCRNNVTQKTNYLVLGDLDFSKLRDGEKSNKLRKAENMIDQGMDLELIPEFDFLQKL